LHMKDEMVDTVGLYHVVFLLYSGVRPRVSSWEGYRSLPETL
jgi:hypothetical protein